MKKENRGGKREGAGPKLKYGEETLSLQIQVPASKRDEIKERIHSEVLKDYLKD